MPIDRRLENNWDKQLEDGLPDSRTRTRKLIQYARMEYEPIYCANCGKLTSLLTPDFSPHMHYVCDTCHRKLNGLAPPGMVEGPAPPTFKIVNGRLTKED